MSLRDLVKQELIVHPLRGHDRDSVISELVAGMVRNSCVQNPEVVIRQVLNREKMGSTGLNKGIAVPHSRTPEVEQVTVAVGFSSDGIDFKALDGELSRLFFMILAPPDQSSAHIRILSEIAGLSKDDELINRLMQASGAEELYTLLTQ